ncbi:cyclin-J [Wyeomyia smithii]|uniref:cyclin-J n=1 Tax=Wyeomyia smithii TaxID=174621 RepID=UPI002467E309|nr:cyclin-J [Wyeomyia smithii]
MEIQFHDNSTLLYFGEQCTEYSDEIIWILQETELNRLTMRYTSPQLRYRDVMVNFIRSIGECELLRRSTVHLAIYLLDAFMDNHSINDNRLNLVALSCLLLAAKMEENEPNVPTLASMNELVRNQYPYSDFILLEVLLLKFFNWHLIIPTAATFAEFWLLNVVGKSDFSMSISDETFFERRARAIELVLEYLDLTLTDIKMTNIRPSLLASACLAAARSSLPVQMVWTETMEELTGYSYHEIATLTRELMNWRACLIAKETACRKRSACDSGYLTEFPADADESDDFEFDTEESDDDIAFVLSCKRPK